MKVLHVIPSYEPAWAFGGTVTATSQLCRALAKQGIDITVYTTDADGRGGHLDVPLNQTVDLGGVKTFYFHCNFGVKKAFYSKGLSRKLKSTVKEFDLVHVSAIWQWIQVDVYKVCRSFSKPYIISAHGSFSPWPWNQSLFKKRLYWQLLGKKTVKEAAAVHFTADEERLKSVSAVPLLGEIPSFVIPNGVAIENTGNFKNIRKILDIPNGRFVILYVGRIHRKKGIHFVMEALKKLDNGKFLFLIVGDKEDSDYVKRLTGLSGELPNSVLWHEPVPKDKVWDFYHSSDLFVLPSYDENFGMVVVEAMACGLPVMISKNVGIWREVQSDNTGFIVEQDVDEIANILKNISNDSRSLSVMSQNARKSVEKRYDIDKVASLMIKAYEDVLTRRKSPELQWK